MGSSQLIAVLIPAYMPDEKLVNLSKELLQENFHEVLIIDDGSGPSCADIFSALEEMGCRVVSHAINMGKGRALKTGFNDLLVRGEVHGVITADADGQHLVRDIRRVSEALVETENTIIMGKRAFTEMPLKSRCGNTITRSVFNFVSGQKIHDTQTGLRGFPMSALPALMALSGERYEYEMNMLLEASALGIKLSEIEIETVYYNGNSGSHFNTLRDSWRIYRLIIMFGGSSLISFLIDYALYALFITLIPKIDKGWLTHVVIATIAARIISSAVNFSINRSVIFAKGKKKNLRKHLIGYYILAACILAANTLLVNWFVSLGVNPYLAKLPVEAILFLTSFVVQKRVVFK